MKRRDFFKRISLGAAAVVAAPAIVKGVVREEPSVIDRYKSKVEEARRRKYPMTYDEAYQFVVTTRPVLISDDQEMADSIKIFVDRPLRINDIVYFDPRHTNKDIPIECLVVHPHAWDNMDLAYTLMPLDLTAKITRSIRRDTRLFLGTNMNRPVDVSHGSEANVG